MISEIKLKIGDRVKMSPMWKHKEAVGTILKITKDYTVVKWDGVNGDWHYTEEQSKRMESYNENR
jgi:hypothetical protein